MGLDPSTRPALVAPTFLPPVELGTAVRTYDAGASPVVAASLNGTVYVAITDGFWRSDDGGMTFQALGDSNCRMVPTCSTTDPGTEGIFDVTLAVTPDETVHWLSTGDLQDYTLPYRRSQDKGETWTPPIGISSNSTTGQPWMSADDDGAIYGVWRVTTFDDEDCIQLFGVCYVKPDATANETITVARSGDGGQYWSYATILGAGVVGPIATDPSSAAVYLPTADGAVSVWRSPDGGGTWNETQVRPGVGTILQIPVAAVDAAGTVYVVWAEDPNDVEYPDDNVGFVVPRMTGIPHVYVSTSRDGGVTFTEPRLLSSPDRPALFPWIVAGDAGRVAVAWYDGALPVPSDHVANQWNVAVAVSVLADQPEPAFETVLATPEPIHVGPICTTGIFCYAPPADQTMGFFFQMAVLPDGSPVLAFAGDADVRMGTVKVYATRMTDGTSMYGTPRGPAANATV